MAILTATGRVAIAKAIAAQPIHLGWGSGDPDWDTDGVPAEPIAAETLVAEIGRRAATSVQYVTPDDNGEIIVPVFGPAAANAGQRRFAISPTPTNNLFMRFNFNFEDAPASIIRELAVFIGTVPIAGLPPGQLYFTPAEIADAGTMLALEYLRERIIRSPNSRQSFEFVLTI